MDPLHFLILIFASFLCIHGSPNSVPLHEPHSQSKISLNQFKSSSIDNDTDTESDYGIGSGNGTGINLTFPSFGPNAVSGSGAGYVRPPVAALPFPETENSDSESQEKLQSQSETSCKIANSNSTANQVIQVKDVEVGKNSNTEESGSLKNGLHRAAPLMTFLYNLNVVGNRGKRPTCDCGEKGELGLLESLNPSLSRPLPENSLYANSITFVRPLKNTTNWSPNQKVVGGETPRIGEYPWRVALQTSILNNASILCGGSILSEKWILTAAHCFDEFNSTTVLYVNAGEHDKSTPAEADNLIIRADYVVIHPRYNNVTYDNDIALIKLERNLTFRQNIRPICLPFNIGESELAGASGVSGGWGVTSENGTDSTVIQSVRLNYLSTHQCRILVGPARAANITDNMVCAMAAGRDTCQGDSGGTLDIFDFQTQRYFAVGIVSIGVGCARSNQPGIYTKIDNYLEFIELITGRPMCRRKI